MLPSSFSSFSSSSRPLASVPCFNSSSWIWQTIEIFHITQGYTTSLTSCLNAGGEREGGMRCFQLHLFKLEMRNNWKISCHLRLENFSFLCYKLSRASGSGEGGGSGQLHLPPFELPPLLLVVSVMSGLTILSLLAGNDQQLKTFHYSRLDNFTYLSSYKSQFRSCGQTLLGGCSFRFCHSFLFTYRLHLPMDFYTLLLALPN